MPEKMTLDGQALFRIYFEEIMLRFVITPGIDPSQTATNYYQDLKDPFQFPRYYEEALNFMTAVLQGESQIAKVLWQSGIVYELGDELRGDLHSQELKSEMRLPWATFAILSDEMQSNYLKGLTRWLALGEERPILPDIPRD